MVDDRMTGDDCEDARAAREIANTVARVEWTGAILFLGVAAICVGVPLVRGVVHGHPLLGLANATLLGLVGLGLLFLINLFALIPVTVVCYGHAASILQRRLEALAGLPRLRRTWTDLTPGAIVVAADGRAWLADRSTGYRPVALDARDILSADAIMMHKLVRPRLRGPAIGLGVPVGGGLIMTVPIGGKAGPTPVRVRHAVRLHYRGAVGDRLTLIPFGRDADGARALSALLVSAVPAA